MTKKKEYTKEEILFARVIYNWLHENSEIGKSGRYRKEVISKICVKDLERFERAIEYLKRIKLLAANCANYMITRESVSDDFQMPQEPQTTAERVYGKPLDRN